MLKDRIEALKNLLKDPNEQVRQSASDAIEKLSAISEINKFYEALLSDDVLTRSRAVFALASIDDQRALEYLAVATADKEPKVRAHAIRIIGEKKAVKYADIIAKRISDSDQVVRAEAIKAIGNMGNIAYLPQLLQLLKEKDIAIITSAIFSIGKLKDPRAEKPLLVLLSHPSPEVRIASVKALAELNFDQT